jgi:predicted nucleic acid-binding protein
MSIFVDTNILLRSIYPSDASHDQAVRATTRLIEAGETLTITPQVVAEFWNAATRPRERNGFG